MMAVAVRPEASKGVILKRWNGVGGACQPLAVIEEAESLFKNGSGKL